MQRSAYLLLVPVGLLLAAATPDPTVPEPRPSKTGWMQRHQDKLREIHAGEVDMIFLGDSITQEIEPTAGSPRMSGVWPQFYGCRHAVNLGFGGDRTSNLLWRIDNGEIDGISPKVAVIMIGTNNIGPYNSSSPDQVAAGIEAVVSAVHHRLPSTRILLLGVPPSSKEGDANEIRMQVNQTLQTHDWAGAPVTFHTTDDVLAPGGKLDTSLYRQPRKGFLVHPNEEGWTKLAAAIEPTIERLLGTTQACSDVR